MKKLRVIYVLAASHSGSTLTAMLLGAHDDACTVGELKLNSIGDVDQYYCSCREKIQKCPFWAAVRERMAQFGESFDLSDPGMDYYSASDRWTHRFERPLYRGGWMELLRHGLLSTSREWRRHVDKVQRRNSNFIRSVLEVTGAASIVDSSKIGSRLNHLLANPAFDVFVVRVIRDGRAVALTYMDPENFADASEPELRGGGIGLSREKEILPMESAAREWRRSNEEASAILQKVAPQNKTVLRYEDLCENSVNVLNGVFEKAGLASIDALPQFRTANPHVVGNGMRMDSTETIEFDERWRNRLSEKELATFDSIAGDLNREFGYR